MASVRPEARWVRFVSLDGYDTSVSLEDALVEDAIVALEVNSKPLPEEMGFPARPIIPHLYAWKSAKWLTRVEFARDYPGGFWEDRDPRGGTSGGRSAPSDRPRSGDLKAS